MVTKHYLASLASASEFPFLIKNVAITQTLNTASIYGFQMYIRGKPWVITIDDYLIYDSLGNSLIADTRWGLWAAAY